MDLARTYRECRQREEVVAGRLAFSISHRGES